MKKKHIWILVVGLILICTTAFVFFSRKKESQISFNTEKVRTGTVSLSVTATGTVEPIDQVDVGTQVSGVIKNIYVDYNSKVKKGQILAELDRSTLTARVTQSKADLFSAENVLDYQQKNFNRTKQLYDTKAISETDYETALYNLNAAKASAEKARSSLKQAEVDLNYATIISPIDGVVLSRSVDAGQTVAASFNTPTLFVIANDLTKMQVEADVDEADIGQVSDGQHVNFTVDAYPDDKFDGTVSQIRLEPTITSNVVTYKVIVDAPNPELKLMPGMTASITIYTKVANDALIVPARALQYNPDPAVLKDFMANAGQMTSKNMTHSQQTAGDTTNRSFDKQKRGSMVWLKIGNQIRPKRVKTGINDGAQVEITEGLQENDEVILNTITDQTASTNSNLSRSPFMPQRPGGARRSQNSSR